MTPVKIEVKDKYLLIQWDDAPESSIRLTSLRRACPCALCNAERDEQGKNYIPIYNDIQVTPKSIRLVGSYAVNIVWQDGHSTGIYEFQQLKNLENKK